MGKFKIDKKIGIKVIRLFYKGLLYSEIATKVNVTPNTIYRFIKKKGLTSKDRVKKPKVKFVKEEIGNRYNNLIVKGFKYNNTYKSTVAITKCDCGRITITTLHSLKLGKKKTCGFGECKYHYKLSVQNGKTTFTGHKEILGSRWAGWRIGAEKRNIPFTVTIQESWIKFLEQDRKCALTGLDIRFHETYQDDKQTASLDRIDSNKGYTKDNIQWVHKKINLMKGNLDEKTFLFFCKKVAKHGKNINKKRI